MTQKMKFSISYALSLAVFLAVKTSFAATESICQEFTKNCSVKKTLISESLDPEDNYVLNVQLGLLSKQQFNELHALYQTPTTEAFDANKNYSLTDFLPTFIQETNGKKLIPHERSVAPELLAALRAQGFKVDDIAYVDANCHSVTWQWINYLQGTGVKSAILALADGDQMILNQTVSAHEAKAGDILIIEGTGGLNQSGFVLHSLIYLGHGLVFEKGNPGEDFPFRISYLSDVEKKYKTVDPLSVFKFFRATGDSKVLAPLKDQFSLKAQRNQQSFGLRLDTLNPSLLEQYIFQETWDYQLSESIFTLGKILNFSEAQSYLKPVQAVK